MCASACLCLCLFIQRAKYCMKMYVAKELIQCDTCRTNGSKLPIKHHIGSVNAYVFVNVSRVHISDKCEQQIKYASLFSAHGYC